MSRFHELVWDVARRRHNAGLAEKRAREVQVNAQMHQNLLREAEDALSVYMREYVEQAERGVAAQNEETTNL